MPDLESMLRAYAVRLDERYPDVTLDELSASAHAERLDRSAGPINPANLVSAERARTVTLSDAEPPSGTSNRRRLLIAAAAVFVVIGVAGLALAITNDDDDQPPAPVATVSVAPTTVATETESLVVIGAYNYIPVTFTKPTSWGLLGLTDGPSPPTTEAPATAASSTAAAPATSAPPTAPDKKLGSALSVPSGAYSNLTQAAAMVEFASASVSNIYSDGCSRTPLDPPAGPTVDDLVTAWANIAQLAPTTPIDITVDGYTGKLIELTAPEVIESRPFNESLCPLGWFGLWYGFGGGADIPLYPDNAVATPNRHFKMLVIDVDGNRLLIAASVDPKTPPQDRAALDALLASIQIG